MALVIEDGSRVAGANSYVTVTEFSTYATARGVTLVDADREKWLILAMDYIEGQMFKGIKHSQDQALQWPRIGVFIDTYSVDSDVIPTLLKEAEMQTAIAMINGYSPLAVVTSSVKRRKVGDLEIEYKDNSVNNPIDPKVNYLLKRLIVNGGSGRLIVSKA